MMKEKKELNQKQSKSREQKKVPSEAKMRLGITSLDFAVGEGFPTGSHVVLIGGSGSQKAEFCYTAAFTNGAMKRSDLPKPERKDIILPETIWYLSFTKTKDDVMRDIRVSFSDDIFEIFSEEIKFKDFISDYYVSSFAPLWGVEEKVKREEGGDTASTLEIIKLTLEFLDKNSRNSLIIIDSLDDLIRAFPKGEENRLLAALREFQRCNKTRWHSLILSHLTKNIFPGEVEESILSLADGVFEFEESEDSGKRMLYCRKFTGVTSEDLLSSRFECKTTPSGFEARKIKLLE